MGSESPVVSDYAVLPLVVSSIGVPLIFTVKIHQIETRVEKYFIESGRNS